jgi:hypothetical protein
MCETIMCRTANSAAECPGSNIHLAISSPSIHPMAPWSTPSIGTAVGKQRLAEKQWTEI